MLFASLRDNVEAFIRQKLGNLLSLEYVWNKERMAVELIIRLTGLDVLKVLEDVKFVASNEVCALTRSQFLMAQQTQPLLLITTLRKVYPDS